MTGSKGIRIKNLALFFIIIFIMSPVFAQNGKSKWTININYASMKPFFQNDQWFVTSEGYHMHPRTEDYTPGLSLGIERKIAERISFELGILYGMPPATLGVIDEFSANDQDFEETQRYHFLSIFVTPNIYIVKGRVGTLYLGPTVGYGMLSEKKITPPFGPQVTWTSGNELIFGGRAGVKFKLNNPALSLNVECLYFSMKTRIEENQTNRKLDKTFGPFGILLGLSYALD